MLDARSVLTAQITVEEGRFLDGMIAAFFPVTLRRAGLVNEGAAIDPTAIDAAVLIVHAMDDRLTPFSTARFTAERITGAQFVAFETGGHLLLSHHAVVRQTLHDFLAKHILPEVRP